MRADHLDVGPAGLGNARAQRLDGLVLVLPELVGVGEVRLLAEQIALCLALVVVQREQGRVRADLLAAEDPRLELEMRRRILLGIIEQGEILGLLLARCERQRLQLGGIDPLVTVGAMDGRDQPRDREPLPDCGECDAEVGGDLLLVSARLQHGAEGLVLVELVHRHALDVLGERHGDRVGIVRAGHDKT